MSTTDLRRPWLSFAPAGARRNSVPTSDAGGVVAEEVTASTATIEVLYERFAGAVYDKCVRILADRAAAEDAVQETFLKAHSALGRISGSGGYLPWLYRIATNTCLNILRTRSRKWSALCEDADRASGEGIDGERVLLGRRLLRALIRRCDERTLAIVIAHYFDEMSQGEIAVQLGISRRAVVKRLAALRVTAKELATEGG